MYYNVIKNLNVTTMRFKICLLPTKEVGKMYSYIKTIAQYKDFPHQ